MSTSTMLRRATRDRFAARAIARVVVVAAIATAMAGGSSCAPSSKAGGDAVDLDRAGHEGTAGEQASGASVSGVATFTASDVARILLVLENTAIARARLAEQRAATIEVRIYAASIVADRTAALDRLGAILRRLKQPSEDPTPGLIESDTERANDVLATLEKGTFDLPFMTDEVASLARLLGLIDASLLPSVTEQTVRFAEDAAVRDLEQELRDVRAEAASRIVHALRVQGVVRAAQPPTRASTNAGEPVVGAAPAGEPARPSEARPDG